MVRVGFDNDRYLKAQSEKIFARMKGHDKLYVEFGGKLIGDKHAARVLPGFDEDVKLNLLGKLKEKAEIILCVYAGDIEQNRMRGDYGITYDQEVLRLLNEYRKRQLQVNSILITRYQGQKSAAIFKKKLERLGLKVYTHGFIAGYPTDIENMFSEQGFKQNAYIETTQPIVIVTGPGAGSGKLATCLNQLYHEYERGVSASYAKFETFPVWNLPLKHPVNVAYEAATVDILDANVIDNYHFEAYGEVTVNYNRDVQMFPVIRRILATITGQSPYESPTDMGVNYVASGIIDDEVVQEAARQEIIRRYYEVETNYKRGIATEEVRERMQLLMEESGLKPTDRAVVVAANNYEATLKTRYQTDSRQDAIAISLDNGTTVTGRTSEIMDASAAAVMNALKALAGIGDQIDLLAPMVLEAIQGLKLNHLHQEATTLSLDELLIALSISAVTNPTAKLAYDCLPELVNAEAHSTVILNANNLKALKRLGVHVTADAAYADSGLFY